MVEGERTEKSERTQLKNQTSEGLQEQAANLLKEAPKPTSTSDSSQALANNGVLPELKLVDGNSSEKGENKSENNAESSNRGVNGQGDRKDVKDIAPNSGEGDGPRSAPKDGGAPGADNVGAPRVEDPGKNDGKIRQFGGNTEEAVTWPRRAGQAEANTRRK
jgi:hypothetical protein